MIESVLGMSISLALGVCAGYVMGERSGRTANAELVAALEHALDLARAGKTGAPVMEAWRKAVSLFSREGRQ